jgi:hypothetical protein
MGLVPLTVAQFTEHIERGHVTAIMAAVKKPGADRVLVIVRVNNKFSEVWDVGP